jgi:hypothetical protein
MRRSDLGDLPQLVARRRIETVAAAIISVPPALHETVPLEVVDERDDAAGVDAHALGERLLTQARPRRDRPHQPNMGRGQADRCQPLGDAFSGVRAQLGEEESHAQVFAASCGRGMCG